VLTVLYTVRSERLFCEQPSYNLLWLWFLDREFSEGSFDHSVFAKNYERELSAEVAKLFFVEVYDLSRHRDALELADRSSIVTSVILS
jgi:transposase